MPAEINDAAVTMIVDTGTQWTAITPETVKRLGLPPDPWNGGLHRGVATFSSSVNAVTRTFRIGGITLEGRSLSVVPLVTGSKVSPPVAGLLGADFLFAFDLDIDLPLRRLTLYPARGCLTRTPPWDIAVAALPLVKSATNRLTLAASVDGHPFRAILDTGATLHVHGLTDIQSATQAAEALRPLAGQ